HAARGTARVRARGARARAARALLMPCGLRGVGTRDRQRNGTASQRAPPRTLVATTKSRRHVSTRHGITLAHRHPRAAGAGRDVVPEGRGGAGGGGSVGLFGTPVAFRGVRGTCPGGRVPPLRFREHGTRVSTTSPGSAGYDSGRSSRQRSRT